MATNDSDRTEQVRRVVDHILRTQPDEEARRWGFVHLYGVAQACAMLALKRGLDAELSTITGMLHDLSTYKTGDLVGHAQCSALLGCQILSGLGCFTESEIAIICTAIAYHRMKVEVHGAYDELLKDADVLQRYLYNTCIRPEVVDPAAEDRRTRLAAMHEELDIAQLARTGETLEVQGVDSGREQ